MQFDDSQLDAENAALIALVETCEKPDTWSSLTNDCIMEGSAIRVPIYQAMHVELISRSVIHADEVPCQVLHEEGKAATSKSYMWVYLSGTDGEPKIVL